VDIIDNMCRKFAELEPTCDDEDEDTNRISTAVLDEIYAEFQDFALKKDALNFTQRIPQKIMTQTDEMRMPSLNKFLNTRYATTSSLDKLKTNTSATCARTSATSLKSLSAHKRGCPSKGV
jgi:hypothetical protein